MSDKVVGILLENKILVAKDFQFLSERDYGKESDGGLDLSFIEALYLVKKSKLEVKKGKTKLSFNKLLDCGLKLDRRIQEKYIVYKDLRDRGLVVKTGFKFGCDFRVYGRGVKVKKGPKTAAEHTKWVVYTVPEDYTCSFQELSRAVRLAHSIRAEMLWAIVDGENNVTYYSVKRQLL